MLKNVKKCDGWQVTGDNQLSTHLVVIHQYPGHQGMWQKWLEVSYQALVEAANDIMKFRLILFNNLANRACQNHRIRTALLIFGHHCDGILIVLIVNTTL